MPHYGCCERHPEAQLVYSEYERGRMAWICLECEKEAARDGKREWKRFQERAVRDVRRPV